jgi:NTP pyrophosphatase (non-canonical NTP hydrolase)
VELAELQRQIEGLYGARDRARGVDGTFRWWVEEVGDLAKAVDRYRGACPRCGATPCACPSA